MSKMSSMPKTSRSWRSSSCSNSSIGSESSSFFSPPSTFGGWFSSSPVFSFASASLLPPSLAAASAARLAGSLASMWRVCHSCRSFCQACHFSLNHSEGCSSSMRVVSLRSSVHLRRYSLLSSDECHAKLTLSKPSSCPGKEKLAKDALITRADRSEICCLRNQSDLSSSVSSTFGGCSSSSSSSICGSCSSSMASSAWPSAPSPSSAASFRLRSISCFLFSLSTCFWRSSIALLRCRSALCAWNSASDFSCLSFSFSS
mmetsp:Transcript_98599/g.254899  ORF Transcript_98599/g.254899 Transcript_98599/m.254899 type:complete len:259 (+) Transcript_98599:595-1371(+)